MMEIIAKHCRSLYREEFHRNVISRILIVVVI
jgi:hypothetical protein